MLRYNVKIFFLSGNQLKRLLIEKFSHFISLIDRMMHTQKLKHNAGKFANLSCKKAISPAKTFGFDGK